MKVLHLCTKVPFPAKDGGSLAILTFIALSRLSKTAVTMLCANTPKHKVLNSNIHLEGIETLSVPVNTNINLAALIFNLFFSKVPYNVSRFKNYKFKLRLKALLLKESFDIVQLEGPHMGIYLPVIKKYSKAKIVLRAHNVEYRLWQEISLKSKSLLKRYFLKLMAQRFKVFESNLISRVDGLIPISTFDLQQMLLFSSPKSYIVIPPGINLSDYVPIKHPQENTLFLIGALDWIPNQQGLIWFLDNVWPKTKQCLPQVTFHIAGRNAPAWLKAKLIGKNIYFHGEVNDAKEFMNSFQLMVVPLFSGSGVRVKIMEAMAMKKAVITTSKGAEGLNATAENELIIADDPHNFTLKIIELMNDKLKRKSLGEAARAFISKEIDNLALANKVEEFYCSLIKLNRL